MCDRVFAPALLTYLYLLTYDVRWKCLPFRREERGLSLVEAI